MGDFVLEHPHGSVYYFDFGNGFADFFFCDLYVSSFHNNFVVFGGGVSYLYLVIYGSDRIYIVYLTGTLLLIRG